MGVYEKGMKILVSVTIVLVLIGCTHSRHAPYSTKNDIENSLGDTRYFLQGCEYRRAVETISRAVARYPNQEKIRNEYILTVGVISKLAESALQRQEYGKAGKLFAILREEANARTEKKRPLAIDPHYLDRQIALCSVKLTEQGLVRYRAGELKDAVDLWKTVLVFDPENGEIKKAIETTTMQMKNLEKIP